MHDGKGSSVWQQTGWGLVSTQAREVQWAEEPHAAGETGMHDLLRMWEKAGQLGGPRGEIIFLAFPTAEAGAWVQTPEPKAEGPGWV